MVIAELNGKTVFSLAALFSSHAIPQNQVVTTPTLTDSHHYQLSVSSAPIWIFARKYSYWASFLCQNKHSVHSSQFFHIHDGSSSIVNNLFKGESCSCPWPITWLWEDTEILSPVKGDTDSTYITLPQWLWGFNECLEQSPSLTKHNAVWRLCQD